MISSRGAKFLGLLAAISVAINLFLAGIFLGGHFRHPPPAQSFEQRLDAIWDELPDADRPISKAIYAQHRDDIIQKWRLSRAAAQRAGKDLRAKTFNDAEIRADFAASNDRFAQFREAVQELFLDVGSKISPEGRQRLKGVGGAL